MSEFNFELQFTLFKEVATFSIQLRDFISVIFIKKKGEQCMRRSGLLFSLVK